MKEKIGKGRKMKRLLRVVLSLAMVFSLMQMNTIIVQAENTNLIDIAQYGKTGFEPFYASDGTKPINVSTKNANYPTAVEEGLQIVANEGGQSGGAFITKKVSSTDDFSLAFSVKNTWKGKL